MRPVPWLLGIGAAGALGFWLLAGGAAMPAYFAAWLFWIGVPMGALPIVMAMEAAGMLSHPLLPVSRAMLPLLPLGTLSALPLLGALPSLFARPGLAPWWTEPSTLALRDGGSLIALSILALLFWITPRRPRRSLARLGLLLSLVLGTLLAVDVVLGPQPALASSLAGLLLIAGQVALAGALAGLVLAAATPPGRRLPAQAGWLLAFIAAFWLFIQFTQYLVVWSANLPGEAGWYLDRLGPLGSPVIGFAALSALAAMVLLPTLIGRIPAALATLNAMLVIALMLVTLLFVLPGFRGRFTLTLADALAVIGFGGLLGGVMLMLVAREAPHDPA